MNTLITTEILLSEGWKRSQFPFYLEKEIENTNPLNSDPQDTSIKLVVHGLYNSQQYAFCFPSGAMLNFNPVDLDDLHTIERMVSFYDCEY